MKINSLDIKLKNTLTMYSDVIVSVLAFLIIFLLDNSSQSLGYLGMCIIFISLYQLIKVRESTELLVLFGLITYINLSVSIGDLLQIGQSLGQETLSWQMAVRLSEYNAIGAKCILAIMAVLNIMINSKYLKKIRSTVNEPIIKKENDYIFYIGLVVLIIFWYFGYGSTRGSTYNSNTQTIYEYCLVIFIVVWFYSGNSKVKKSYMYLYAFIYILQALIRGDRSSAFPMIVIIFLIQNYRLNLKRLSFLAIGGIFASNIISIYRLSYSFSAMKDLYLSKYGMTAFLSDTVSQSYYTGISIANVHDLIPNTSTYFLDFLGGILMGGGFRNADVGAVAYNYLLNKGGGFYFSWFYFWFGFVGVICAGVLLGYIIRKLFASSNNYIRLYKLVLVAMCFRWYLYTPFVLFRSILFVFSMLLFISFLVEKLTAKK
ncbi:hypothetical protein [Clostridium chrysemydis]|uniref:hypothetical protein n=1 Tax=Clostridium chrysemydis TaxID=2665504 RepID=UPI00188321CC|nr:hypothetical protein [Clostridium chrysemydis]